MKATLSQYRQTPRKVRLVANLVKGKSVPQAYAILATLPKRASLPLKKLIESAVANAGAPKSDAGKFIVKNITVDKGLVFRRFNPVSRGRAHPIKKRASHISVVLAAK